MSAEDAIDPVSACVSESALRDFRRHAQEARVQPVDAAAERIALEIELLQREEEKCAQATQRDAVYREAIELVAVDCEMAQARVGPCIFLKDFHADQVRHDVGKAEIV